jgi:DNA-binding MarR family transcriptional regulator
LGLTTKINACKLLILLIMSSIEQLITTTCELQRMLATRIRKSAPLGGCTILQVQVLLYISEHKGTTHSEIAEDFDITPAAVTQLADRLVAAGYLGREQDGRDHRISHLRLTKRADEQITTFRNRRHDELRSLFQTLSEGDQIQLLRLHNQLTQSIRHKM